MLIKGGRVDDWMSNFQFIFSLNYPLALMLIPIAKTIMNHLNK